MRILHSFVRPAIAACATAIFVANAVPAHAAVITYTFEGPSFTVLTNTPLLNVAPNVGDPTFDTDFTSSPEFFSVAPFVANSLFSGNSLADPTSAADTLTLVFSSPIVALSVDFAINNSVGSLFLTSSSGSTSQTAAIVGGNFPGGTLVFSSAVPFSSVNLFALNGTAPLNFAIDDLTLTTATAPEPGALLLLGMGLLGAGVRRLRRKRT